MTKDEIKARLDELDVEYTDDMKKDDLEALLDQAQREVPPSGETEAEPAEEAPSIEVNAAPTSDEIDVVHPERCEYLRTYSRKVHGPEYRDLAKEYATKVAGSALAASGELDRLKVTYRAHSKEIDAYYDKVEVFTGADMRERALQVKHEHNGTVYYRW